MYYKVFQSTSSFWLVKIMYKALICIIQSFTSVHPVILFKKVSEMHFILCKGPTWWCIPPGKSCCTFEQYYHRWNKVHSLQSHLEAMFRDSWPASCSTTCCSHTIKISHVSERKRKRKCLQTQFRPVRYETLSVFLIVSFNSLRRLTIN